MKGAGLGHRDRQKTRPVVAYSRAGDPRICSSRSRLTAKRWRQPMASRTSSASTPWPMARKASSSPRSRRPGPLDLEYSSDGKCWSARIATAPIASGTWPRPRRCATLGRPGARDRRPCDPESRPLPSGRQSPGGHRRLDGAHPGRRGRQGTSAGSADTPGQVQELKFSPTASRWPPSPSTGTPDCGTSPPARRSPSFPWGGRGQRPGVFRRRQNARHLLDRPRDTPLRRPQWETMSQIDPGIGILRADVSLLTPDGKRSSSSSGEWSCTATTRRPARNCSPRRAPRRRSGWPGRPTASAGDQRPGRSRGASVGRGDRQDGPPSVRFGADDVFQYSLHSRRQDVARLRPGPHATRLGRGGGEGDTTRSSCRRCRQTTSPSCSTASWRPC